jgi:hypothetical protein
MTSAPEDIQIKILILVGSSLLITYIIRSIIYIIHEKQCHKINKVNEINLKYFT